MFELCNEQRKHFALEPVDKNWIRIELKPSPYDQHNFVAYHDGRRIRKYIECGEHFYREYGMDEMLSEDLKMLLPKSGRGKAVPLTGASLKKRSAKGMELYFCSERGTAEIAVYSYTSLQNYFSSVYEELPLKNIDDFSKWVENWCSESTAQDFADITEFASRTRKHVKFREGDVFRFKINRRMCGYGRVLLDYAKMRSDKTPMWDILAGKPVACSVYHIVTERKDVTLEELSVLQSLPAVNVMDNHLFYGEDEIIGNVPVGEREPYPIMYGNSKIVHERAVMLQCGRLYRRLENSCALYDDFTNGGIGFDLSFRLPVLRRCIAEESNAAYWEQDSIRHKNLRNPKYRKELKRVCKQMQISITEIACDN